MNKKGKTDQLVNKSLSMGLFNSASPTHQKPIFNSNGDYDFPTDSQFNETNSEHSVAAFFHQGK
jgi:hypothetical protein